MGGPHGWRQELIARSALEIADAARELHRRLARFVEPLAKVGRQLDSAVGAYNQAIGSFDHRVVPQVRRIEDAGAASERAVQAPAALEGKARRSAASLQDDEDHSGDDRRAGVAELPAPEAEQGAVEAAA